MEKLNFQVPQTQDGRMVSDFLRAAGLTAGFLRSVKYLPDGICMDGVQVRTNERVRGGGVLTVQLPPEPATGVLPEEMPLSILYESNFAMVLNKPAGLLVHPSVAMAQGTLAGGWCFLMEQRGSPAPFRPITRLDKDTSGLVLCAKNRFAAPILSAQLEKTYLAVTEGELPPGPGRIDAPIALAEGCSVSRCVAESGKPSSTLYYVLKSGTGHSLVLVRTLTGRTHQIRVHFSYLGHPLAGDDMYGGSRELIGRHALHAARLTFGEPFAPQPCTVCAPPPADFVELCEKIGISKDWIQLPEQVNDLLLSVSQP